MTQHNNNLHFIGQSPLDIAVEEGHSAIVKLLIEKGALQHIDDGKLFQFHLKFLIPRFRRSIIPTQNRDSILAVFPLNFSIFFMTFI